MPRTRTPYRVDFREQIVALVRAGRSAEELAKEFEPCAATIHSWVKQAERDAGRRADILSSRARGAAPTAPREEAAAPGARDTLKGQAIVRHWFQNNGERLGCSERRNVLNVLEFMTANRAVFPIEVMAKTMGVSRSASYAWRDRPASARAVADAALSERIAAIHAASRQSYGAPRVHAELADEGVHVGRKRVERLMKANGLAGVSRRKGTRTTIRDERVRQAYDLVDRNFYADTPDKLWVADLT